MVGEEVNNVENFDLAAVAGENRSELPVRHDAADERSEGAVVERALHQKQPDEGVLRDVASDCDFESERLEQALERRYNNARIGRRSDYVINFKSPT